MPLFDLLSFSALYSPVSPVSSPVPAFLRLCSKIFLGGFFSSPVLSYDLGLCASVTSISSGGFKFCSVTGMLTKQRAKV